MLKGHVQIDLHNHKSGFKERIEGDNMITDAVKYVVNNYIGGGVSISEIMPLCEKALGGLMLFDKPLTEDKSNIFLPSEAHLVAYAGRKVNTNNPIMGSLNQAETHKTDTGYVTVWDFSTSQANGTIQSLGLTNYQVGDSANPFYCYLPYAIHPAMNPNGLDCDMAPLCYDVKKQTLYYIDMGVGTSTDSRENDDYTYTYIHNFTIYKEYIPTTLYGVADATNVRHYPEQVKTGTIENTIEAGSVANNFNNGYDGYAYLVIVPENSSDDGKFTYWTMKLSDYSFEISEAKEIVAKDCHFSRVYGVVSKGLCYIQSYDKKSIYIVDLSNENDVRQVNLPEGYSVDTTQMAALRNGGIRLAVTNGSSYLAICYPDGNIIIDPIAATGDNSKRYGLITDGLLVWGVLRWISYNTSAYAYPCTNYLGSIFNLTQPITKTAETSMKITYTLTDVE